LFLILDRLFLIRFLNKMGAIFSTLFTFLIVMIGWVIFRLEDLASINIYLVKLFSFDFNFEINSVPSFWFIAIIATFFSIFTAFKIGRKIENFVLFQNYLKVSNHFIFTLSAIVLLVVSMISITSSDFNPFIYFRF